MSARRRVAIPGQSEVEDRLLAMVAALASELAVTRERLDTVERLLGQKTILDASEIEAFVPSPSDAAQRDGIRRRIIDRVFRPARDAATRARSEQETGQ